MLRVLVFAWAMALLAGCSCSRSHALDAGSADADPAGSGCDRPESRDLDGDGISVADDVLIDLSFFAPGNRQPVELSSVYAENGHALLELRCEDQQACEDEVVYVWPTGASRHAELALPLPLEGRQLTRTEMGVALDGLGWVARRATAASRFGTARGLAFDLTTLRCGERRSVLSGTAYSGPVVTAMPGGGILAETVDLERVSRVTPITDFGVGPSLEGDYTIAVSSGRHVVVSQDGRPAVYHLDADGWREVLAAAPGADPLDPLNTLAHVGPRWRVGPTDWFCLQTEDGGRFVEVDQDGEVLQSLDVLDRPLCSTATHREVEGTGEPMVVYRTDYGYSLALLEATPSGELWPITSGFPGFNATATRGRDGYYVHEHGPQDQWSGVLVLRADSGEHRQVVSSGFRELLLPEGHDPVVIVEEIDNTRNRRTARWLNGARVAGEVDHRAVRVVSAASGFLWVLEASESALELVAYAPSGERRVAVEGVVDAEGFGGEPPTLVGLCQAETCGVYDLELDEFRSLPVEATGTAIPVAPRSSTRSSGRRRTR